MPKIGDLVICVGDIDKLKTHNHIGILQNFGIEFLHKFSDKLHDLDGIIKNKNGWYLKKMEDVKPFDDNQGERNMPLLFSNRLKEVLAYSLSFLIDYERIYHCDVSFIDFSFKNNTVSCLSKINYDKLENKAEVWTTKMRQNISIGRFIKKISPNESDQKIEEYTNDYKFSYDLNKKDMTSFKIYSGIDMAKWYLSFNYAPGGGSLNSSCMKHVKSQRRLPIYLENPEKIRMLVVTNKENKLLGRALLWKLDEPKGEIYMDRVYTTEDYLEKMFYEYAKKRNFITKFDVDKENLLLKVQLDRDYGPPQTNPFMDTFKFFVREENYLTNKFLFFKKGEYYEFIDHD
jgi:hypothetical protein